MFKRAVANLHTKKPCVWQNVLYNHHSMAEDAEKTGSHKEPQVIHPDIKMGVPWIDVTRIALREEGFKPIVAEIRTHGEGVGAYNFEFLIAAHPDKRAIFIAHSDMDGKYSGGYLFTATKRKEGVDMNTYMEKRDEVQVSGDAPSAERQFTWIQIGYGAYGSPGLKKAMRGLEEVADFVEWPELQSYDTNALFYEAGKGKFPGGKLDKSIGRQNLEKILRSAPEFVREFVGPQPEIYSQG